MTALLARYCLQGPFGLRRKTDKLELSYDGEKETYKVDKFDDFTVTPQGKCSAKQEVTVSQVFLPTSTVTSGHAMCRFWGKLEVSWAFRW